MVNNAEPSGSHPQVPAQPLLIKFTGFKLLKGPFYLLFVLEFDHSESKALRPELILGKDTENQHKTYL